MLKFAMQHKIIINLILHGNIFFSVVTLSSTNLTNFVVDLKIISQFGIILSLGNLIIQLTAPELLFFIRATAQVPLPVVDTNHCSKLFVLYDCLNLRHPFRNPQSYTSDEDGTQLSPVLFREKLIKQFNHRGFIKFRNLAKISRPKKKKKKNNERDEAVKEKDGKVSAYHIELVNDEDNAEDWSGLIGEEIKGSWWRGPTRLLLLDERYAEIEAHMLPEAVKVA
jgi:hypothetical protein